jgi:(1->4)-alpha-D-glucan 1-alpha-D-glucosylmutase
VEQPAELLDVVAEEAHMLGATVITEELGTPPPRGAAPFRQRGFLSQVPLISDQFDLENPPAVSSLSCHDLPTIAACLNGPGGWPVLNDSFLRRARRRLLALEPGIQGQHGRPAAAALLDRLAQLGPRIVLATLEDMLGLTRPVNLPGVSEERWPSFRHRLPPLEDILNRPVLASASASGAGR